MGSMWGADKEPTHQWARQYRLHDLHRPHGLVRSHRRPIGELLVARGFEVEAVGQRSQLVAIAV